MSRKGRRCTFFTRWPRGIADDSFLGVYVLEVIAFAAALFFAWRIAGRKAPGAAQMPLRQLSRCWRHVCSQARRFRVETAQRSFACPFCWVRWMLPWPDMKKREGRCLFAGCWYAASLQAWWATIKYTLLGLWIGLCLCEGIVAIRQGGLVRHSGVQAPFCWA